MKNILLLDSIAWQSSHSTFNFYKSFSFTW